MPIKQITAIYLGCLEKFRKLPFPTTAEEEAAFTQLLQSLAANRTSIPKAIGSLSCDELSMEQLHEMEDALHRFFTARV
eukprot:scaffold6107_cov64-Cylindrotheca_fusiformis.AAC.1